MSYLSYLCLSAYRGTEHILCCVFVLFFFVMCTLCCQFLWIVHFLLSLRYSLTFILTTIWISCMIYNYTSDMYIDEINRPEINIIFAARR